MSDPSVLAELEVPPRQTGPVPFLWMAVVLLTLTALVAVATGAADKHEVAPKARLAAAATAAEDVDFAFESTVSTGVVGAPGIRLTGRYDADTHRIAGTVKVAGQEIEIISDGAVEYLGVPAGNPLAQLAGGKPWLRMDLAALGAGANANPAGENPLDTFARLGEISGPIVRVGTEDVRSEPTTHFRTTVDASARKLPPLVTDAQRDSLRNIAVDVWLDGQNRPRRCTQSLDLTSPLATHVVTTTEAFDYGKAVSVDVPPADQVTDFDPAAMAQNLQQLGAATPSD